MVIANLLTPVSETGIFHTPMWQAFRQALLKKLGDTIKKVC
jgi:cytochrome c556